MGGWLYRRLIAGSTEDTVQRMALKASTWYVAQIVVDGNNQFKVKVWSATHPRF